MLSGRFSGTESTHLSRGTLMTTVKYVAEWCVRQFIDPETGDGDPDRDEYGRRTFGTFDEAKAIAISKSKAAGAVEWWSVAEYSFNEELGIPIRCDAAWDCTRAWCGDWEGNCEETR
jgi:hypothetical protein